MEGVGDGDGDGDGDTRTEVSANAAGVRVTHTYKPHHLTTSPPHHLTTSPPHHLTTSPPHHPTTSSLLHLLCAELSVHDDDGDRGDADVGGGGTTAGASFKIELLHGYSNTRDTARGTCKCTKSG